MLLLFLCFLQYNPQTLVVPPFKHTLGFYRASKYYLQLFLGPGYDYHDPQGICAVKLKELDNPKTMGDDDEVSVFAVNSGAGQIIHNIGFEAVKVYGDSKMFSEPKGIAVNEDGLIALADYGNKRVVKLQYKNGKVSEIGEIRLPGRPYDVGFDSKNNLYVTDFDHSKIYVFAVNDSLLAQFGEEGQALGEIFHPMGIEVIDSAASYNYYKDDFIVITDNQGLRISKFSIRGQFLASVQNTQLGLAQANFLFVAVDYFGSIYIADEVNDQIHKFDHNLDYIISVGRTGTGHGEFYSPRGISISRNYGQVFISEKEGGQYLWLMVDGFVVGCFPEKFTPTQPGTTLAIYTTEQAQVDIAVVNKLGEKVRDLIHGIKRPAGEYLVVWDGLDNNNMLVEPGVYEFIISLKSLHGHGRRLEKILKAGVTCI